MKALLRHPARRSRREGLASGESGQALLELALVAPLLILLVMAIFQFAFVMESQMGLTNAVREAGRRVAATVPVGAINWANEETWVRTQLCGGSGCNTGLLRENVQGFDQGGLWPSNPDIKFCSDTVEGVTQYRVQIDVKYKHPVFFAPMTFATDAIDGSPNGFWDLTASAQMRMESIDATIPQPAAPDGTCT